MPPTRSVAGRRRALGRAGHTPEVVLAYRRSGPPAAYRVSDEPQEPVVGARPPALDFPGFAVALASAGLRAEQHRAGRIAAGDGERVDPDRCDHHAPGDRVV